MKILVDMNLSPSWANFLLANNIEAVHWLSIGSHNAPDNEIISYAKENNFTILTNDLDFGYFLALTHSKKPSVMQIKTGALRHSRIGEIVINAIKMLSSDIDEGALVTIDPHKTRVSLLPL